MFKSRNKSKKYIFIIPIIAAVLSGVIYWASLPRTSLAIDGIECNSMEQAVFHIHAHLDIYINGQPFTVPASIGIIQNKCLYWLHTHDTSGIIHIEAPYFRSFTLGEFFDIWNKPFSNNGIFDNAVQGSNTLKVFVNGVETSGNYRDIILGAHDEIVIVYGTPPAKMPTSYAFPRGL